MKITKPNGEIVECSVDEYKEILELEKSKSRTEFIQKYHKEVTTNNAKKSKNEYMKEYMRHYRKDNVINGKSHKHWKKSEDDVILNNTVDEALKLLPHRSRISIYSRRSNLRLSGKNVPTVIIQNNDNKCRSIRAMKSHKRWSKSEDKILMNNTFTKCMKLLRGIRSFDSVKTRRNYLLRAHNKRHINRTTDKRIKMMRYVSIVGNKFMKNGMSKNQAMKKAFEVYKENKHLI